MFLSRWEHLTHGVAVGSKAQSAGITVLCTGVQGLPGAFRRRTSNLFGLVWTYLQRCCHDPSRPLPRPVQPSQAIGPGRQRSGNLEEARRDGRGISAIRRTARTDALTCSVLIQSERQLPLSPGPRSSHVPPASSAWLAVAEKAETCRFTALPQVTCVTHTSRPLVLASSHDDIT
jgi:hypothetical protein